jgi:sorbitol-specific phosphotransferase system component IIBC
MAKYHMEMIYVHGVYRMDMYVWGHSWTVDTAYYNQAMTSKSARHTNTHPTFTLH